jgi:pimeloyl-ACP methyl ester carboxylesterase
MENYGYTDAWKGIIRPPRDEYTDEELGPIKFIINKKSFQRTDFDLVNERKQKLKCSFFEPIESERPSKELPCVIYLHGNSSSRVEAVPYVRVFLPLYITIFCFDFSGSGKSDGEYISLGWWEREDLKIVVDYLRKSGKTSTIGLWGRSMGAATALLHADRDPSIAGLVLDSPFSSLIKLAEELYKKYAGRVPGFVYSMAQWYVKKKIKSTAKFSIDDLVPINHVKSTFIPALFVVAKEDSLINPKHGQELYEAYAGDKNLIWVDGDHNSQRPHDAITSIYIFFFNTLQVDKLLPGVTTQNEVNLKEKYEPFQHAIPSAVFNANEEFNQSEMTEQEMIEMATKLSLETAEEEEKASKSKQPEPKPKASLENESAPNIPSKNKEKTNKIGKPTSTSERKH